MTSFTLRKGNPASTRTDVVVVGVAVGKNGALEVIPGGEKVGAAYGRKWLPLLKSMGVAGKAGECVRMPTGGTLKASTLVVVGTGRRAELNLEAVRRAAGVAARSLANAASVALALPAADAEHLRAVLEGFSSGGYTIKSGPDTSVSEVIVFTDIARKAEAAQVVAENDVLRRAVDRTRAWVNQPPNELNPPAFAAAAAAAAKGTGLKVTVLDEHQLAELGCGGILGVGQGSATPPRLVRLDWKPRRAKAHVALVGKGITFDSGGLSIKPATSMREMKFDMAGAAAVISTMLAIAELKLPIRVTGFAPMAENAVSGTSMRPGDVLKMRDGRTVEVTNTDAEGRLILADALALAVEEKPDAIANIATLTGAAVVALGDRVAGVFGTDDQVAAAMSAANRAGELAWPMPIPDAIRERVQEDSKIADLLQHNFVRWGSSSYAAAFVQEFAGGLPFVHLDIAGTAWNGGAPWGHVPTGATGYGVATLLEWTREHSRA